VSDFLGNIAARTIASPSMRPRGQMRFEPPPDAAPEFTLPWPLPHENAAKAPATTSAADPVTAADRVAGDHRAQPQSEAPVIPLNRQSAFLAAAGVEAVATEVTPTRDASPPAPAIVEGARAAAQIVRAPVRGTKAEVGSQQLFSREHSPSIGEPVAEPSAEVFDRVASPAPRAHRYDEEPARVQPAWELVDVQAARGERARRFGRQGTANARADTFGGVRAADHHAAGSAAGEPLVQVSIGRIEVRATVAPATPAAPRRSSAMSIDQYVARRKERR
jgi:hypothetical protein